MKLCLAFYTAVRTWCCTTGNRNTATLYWGPGDKEVRSQPVSGPCSHSDTLMMVAEKSLNHGLAEYFSGYTITFCLVSYKEALEYIY